MRQSVICSKSSHVIRNTSLFDRHRAFKRTDLGQPKTTNDLTHRCRPRNRERIANTFHYIVNAIRSDEPLSPEKTNGSGYCSLCKCSLHCMQMKPLRGMTSDRSKKIILVVRLSITVHVWTDRACAVRLTINGNRDRPQKTAKFGPNGRAELHLRVDIGDGFGASTGSLCPVGTILRQFGVGSQCRSRRKSPRDCPQCSLVGFETKVLRYL